MTATARAWSSPARRQTMTSFLAHMPVGAMLALVFDVVVIVGAIASPFIVWALERKR